MVTYFLHPKSDRLLDEATHGQKSPLEAVEWDKIQSGWDVSASYTETCIRKENCTPCQQMEGASSTSESIRMRKGGSWGAPFPKMPRHDLAKAGCNCRINLGASLKGLHQARHRFFP
jgi:hypothetical protein